MVEMIENGDMPLQVEHNGQDDEEQDDGSMDTNDMECKTIQLIEGHIAGQKLLDFIIGKGSFNFACFELLQME